MGERVANPNVVKQLVDDVAALNSNIAKYTLGTAIDLTSYASVSNPYTCPSDGYIRVVPLRNTSPFIGVHIVQSGADTQVGIQSNTQYTMVLMPVKKGMQVYVSDNSGSGGSLANIAEYIPFV